MVVLMNKLRTQMRWIMIIIAVAFILSSFLMYGAGSRGTDSHDGTLSDYAVAEINGRRLMISTLYEGLRIRMDGSGGREVTPMDFQAVLEEYAIELQLAQEIQSSGITATDEEIDQALRDYIDNVFPTRESFHQYLERTGRRQADYRQNLAQQIIRQRFVEESIGTITISEDEAMEFYDGMKALFFRQPPGYMANLARFTSEEEAGKARELLYEGRPWDETTFHDAVAPSDIIFITEQPVFFSDAAFDGLLLPMKPLDIGVVSPVFEMTNDEFAVGVKSERIEETFTPFDEVSDDIRAFLHQQKWREALSNFTSGLLSRANIVILDPSLFQVPADETFADAPETDGD